MSLPSERIPLLSGSWRKEIAAITENLHYLCRWLQAKNGDENSQALVDAIEAHLKAVRHYISRRFGINQTAILGHLQSAQENILRLAPLSYVHSCMPSIIVQARKGLGSTDLQLNMLEGLAKQPKLTEDERQTVVSCLSGANEQIRENQVRLQSFRNVIVATAGFLLLLVAIIGAYSLLYDPTLLPICFSHEQNGADVVSCPSSSYVETNPDPQFPEDAVLMSVKREDVLFVMFLGFLGAAMSAALAIRNVRGSSDPYSIPIALGILKLPTGALTALVGMILIRAGLVPGIETLKSSAEIIAWALAFGFSQQLFTGVIDRQARSVLEQTGASVDQPLRSRPSS
jgi:hypothetical protein